MKNKQITPQELIKLFHQTGQIKYTDKEAAKIKLKDSLSGKTSGYMIDINKL